MFTGIITDIGRVRAIAPAGDTRIEIATGLDLSDLAIGGSIACSGVCLSVVEKGKDWFAVQASSETLARTTLGNWRKGTPVNLERAVRLGDELSGHLLSGHIDGTARVLDVKPDGESLRFRIQAPAALQHYVAPKGSIALDGVSLTVNEVEGAEFTVNLIPHTRQMTTFGSAKAGTQVNMEVDLLARYLARLLEKE
ncbi:MAG: riboflavin synthase [Alphaproteobacteria bacterium]